jgi:hypothetical protein
LLSNYLPEKVSWMSGMINCLFLALGLPLSLFLLGYGLYLTFTGKADYGVFLLVIAVLLLAAVGSGYLQDRGRKSTGGSEGKRSGKKKR